MIDASWIRPHLRPSLVLVNFVYQYILKPNVPVTKYAYQYLSNYYANDFHVVDSGNPSLVAFFISGPTISENRLEQRLDVADREEDVTASL